MGKLLIGTPRFIQGIPPVRIRIDQIPGRLGKSLLCKCPQTNLLRLVFQKSGTGRNQGRCAANQRNQNGDDNENQDE